MSDLPEAAGFDLFDDDDEEHRTVVDTSFWNQPEIPDYPAVAYLGPYEILGLIARGGMAEVYLAREWDDSGKARYLVVKRVLPEMEHNPELLGMFLEEGRVAVRLYHPNVCHVYECGELDGVTFMALEWVYGPSLQEVVKRADERGGCIPWPVAVEIVSQVAAALHYVHHAKGVGGKPLNIVHRDVSPHNVMMSWSGGVKLLDFGIAKTSHDATSGGQLVGKYGYMSPEQAQSMRVDPRSDVFALGIVLYEALTGEELYDRPTLLDTLSAIVREPTPSLRAERPELPETLEAIVQRALAKDPAARFQSAGELRAALKGVLRAKNQIVTEQRVALFLEGLFDEGDKIPLKGTTRKLTGSFQAISDDGAAAVVDEQVTFQSFDHASSRPPPGPAASEARPARRGTPIPAPLLWVGLGVLALAMAGVGATVALWVLSP
ncbi:MAG TPA: serine/threonine-protein kinase [Sandaracinaceae bacterium LLY-WYZ-13_1]|nr:serine/threonine-protein kinase [Sandaracinaceae bacterium LLY-WYZ-13_1]